MRFFHSIFITIYKAKELVKNKEMKKINFKIGNCLDEKCSIIDTSLLQVDKFNQYSISLIVMLKSVLMSLSRRIRLFS